jgi:GNAT superfamily N-acetyltransferase
MPADSLMFCPARAADLAAAHALIESGYRGDSARRGWTHEADLLEGHRTNRASLEAILDQTDQVLLLALADGEIVGCVHLTATSATTAYFGMLTVDPRRQAGGLGKRLIAAAEQLAKARFGAATMELCVLSQRAELIAYYERRGYRLTGETRPFPVEMDPPFTLRVMSKGL